MTTFFWDGREQRLDTAAVQPFTNPVEMGLESTTMLMKIIEANPEYVVAFSAAFPNAQGITMEQIGQALAAFIRSTNKQQSAFDRHRLGRETAAWTADQQAGLAVFAGKAACNECHRLKGEPVGLTDDQFHHLGVSDLAVAGNVAQLLQRIDKDRRDLEHFILAEPDISALGRFITTRKPADLAAFRTPSLRNVAVTQPYMHDGSVATLEAAVDQEIYYRGLSKGRPLSLTLEERRQLVVFLRALTDDIAPVTTGKTDRFGASLAPAPQSTH